MPQRRYCVQINLRRGVRNVSSYAHQSVDDAASHRLATVATW